MEFTYTPTACDYDPEYDYEVVCDYKTAYEPYYIIRTPVYGSSTTIIYGNGINGIISIPEIPTMPLVEKKESEWDEVIDLFEEEL
jgi:hypothetical protein